MKKRWLLAVGLVLVLAIVGLAGCQPSGTVQGVSIQQEGIWVSGQGKVTAVPDIATLSLGIEAQEASVADAQSKATEAMNKVMDALTTNGIAKKDIQTQYFNISRRTRWDDKTQQEITLGYRVTNTVTAKIRDIDKAGTIVDAVALAGGDLTRINSINFSVDDPTAYYKEARDKAMSDARNKGEQLATLAEVKLGKPTYISENSYYPTVSIYKGGVMMGANAPAPTTPISQGEMEITLSVQVVYAILH